jgi:two-component system sensor histidine kinase QseC
MSIKRQLLLLIISTVTLASFFAAIHGYRSSIEQLESVFDQELESVAEFILTIAEVNENFPSTINSKFAYQLSKANKAKRHDIISSSSHMVNYRANNKKIGFSEDSFDGKRWRTLSIEKPPFTLIVAHPAETRIASAEQILLVTILPIIIAIPIIAFIIFYIIQKSLKPLISLSTQLKQKSMDDLSIIAIDQKTLELTPVIDRINSLLHRLSDAFDREKQLTANAAHELRTPISVLTINTHNLLEDYKNGTLTQSAIFELEANVKRMAHVIEQVIALYRFTPESFIFERKTIDLEPLLQEVISNNYELVLSNKQNIMLLSKCVSVQGDYFALYTLFENLLRNAIKYSGATSDINVEILIRENRMDIVVEDSGSGVLDAELGNIFNRFYRAKNHNERVKSSGLGLSIVEHIAVLHQASVSASHSSMGGLKVTLSFTDFDVKSFSDDSLVGDK